MRTTLALCALLVSFSVLAEESGSGQIQRTEILPEPAPQQQAAQQSVEEQAGFSRGSVMRSTITSAIVDREPADNLDNITNELGEVKFFTELRDMSGQVAKHRWEHDGKVMAEVPFDVKGHRWRVWSSKKMMPEWAGEWKVSVINGAGEVISEKSFEYVISQQQVPTASEQPQQTQ